MYLCFQSTNCSFCHCEPDAHTRSIGLAIVIFKTNTILVSILHCNYPSWQKGKVILTRTRTRIKCPLSSSTAPVNFWTSSTVSQRLLATYLVMKHIGISWTCTQNKVFVNTKSWTGLSVTYLYSITWCLSKLQGWLWRIRSTSLKLSKTKRTLWSLWLRILKPLVDLHICLNVLVMASIFRKCRVKNCVARMNSPNHCFLI